MGRSPPHIIFKRVVKGMLKNIMPGSLEEVQEAHSRLQACWEVNGIGSAKCANLENYFNSMNEENDKYVNFIKNKRYEMHALRYLAPAKRKLEDKGRYRSVYFVPKPGRFRIRDITLDSDSDK